MIRTKPHLYFSNGGKACIWTLGTQNIRWQTERTKMSFCFEILWFFGAWLMTGVCWDVAVLWSLSSSLLFSTLCCSGIFLGKSFYLFTFSSPEQLPHLFWNTLVFGGPPLCERVRITEFILTVLLVGGDHSYCKCSGGRGAVSALPPQRGLPHGLEQVSSGSKASHVHTHALTSTWSELR